MRACPSWSVSGVGEKSKWARKRFGRRKVKKAKKRPWGPFLEAPGKLTGPVSYFEIKVLRKVGCVLTSNEVNFVSLVEKVTV